ncbi:hypothetical protein M885DRAFT_125995 [Pelagophyceae sp. CCMP2097]|nr:hypothetical protein M885DRAFT_125995 [Pelagophyceae sp. CCMP2097]|mmetsp:Transcript_12111/g.40411  ORF Transcript_12111/g.40411 Transcript_12111/m.40411 type:complete len:153 (-) Transcript_12111:45-503(-)
MLQLGRPVLRRAALASRPRARFSSPAEVPPGPVPGSASTPFAPTRRHRFNTWAKGYNQHFFNVGVSFFMFILANQIYALKVDGKGLELERDNMKAELASIRERAQTDLTQMAGRLGVKEEKLKAELERHFAPNFAPSTLPAAAAEDGKPRFV